ITRVFDNNPATIGSTISERSVLDISELERELADAGTHLGIIAVPAQDAQAIAERLIGVGVGGILNFAPRRLEVDESVAVLNVDFSLTLEQLAFQVNLGRNDPAREGESS
ncbi:MAG: redox-sensing transcriptional repressor Rex, partial [Planctomycetota bacterium]|nr:redox-sensing transcriptional repressor Rex [Planctomycetota bacterium]